MIELYPFLLTRGITPDTPAHALGLTVRQPGLGVEGNLEKPRPVQPMDEAGAKERAACTMGKSGLPAGNLGKEIIKWERMHTIEEGMTAEMAILKIRIFREKIAVKITRKAMPTEPGKKVRLRQTINLLTSK